MMMLAKLKAVAVLAVTALALTNGLGLGLVPAVADEASAPGSGTRSPLSQRCKVLRLTAMRAAQSSWVAPRASRTAHSTSFQRGRPALLAEGLS